MKKNTSSTSSSSGSTTSSSCSGSSSSEYSESSSSGGEEKVANGNINKQDSSVKPQAQVTTRRKSSEFKGSTAVAAASKSRLANGLVNQRPRTNEEAASPVKIPNSSTCVQRRKNSCNVTTTQSLAGEIVSNAKATQNKETPNSTGKSGRKVPVKTTPPTYRSTAENINKAKTATRAKLQPKRKASSKAINYRKSSIEDSESGSMSGDGSSSSESEGSDSSNSFASQPLKATKGKRAPIATKIARSDSDEMNGTTHETTPRKLTRSLITRRSKQQMKQGGVAASDSDSDALGELDKRLVSKSPAKKCIAAFGGVSKCKVKKEGIGVLHSKPMSPPHQIEKKCPIDACDSSGHLSGNLDKHFLPEACPIYHNMSASECKERANERKLRNEQQPNTNSATTSQTFDSLTNKTLTPEQKEFLSSIRESRARFRPLTSTVNPDKVKLEKDCTDEDREPTLTGLVPDYDLQLFREAQATASEKIEDELKDLPVGKGIKYITMGKYKMKVWYQSPYPDDAARLPQMYICEFCLRYQKSETGIKRHAHKCIWRHPPGDEIYRKGKLQVWQVDGKRHKQYCQHLCLLAKFFLDHKTLYYDVEPFLFYIMTLADVDGCHIVGYFSKEKNSFYNVSCILTLPPYQRKGYGRLLIDFSYLLTKVEGKIGSPEKPLSDLGLISYRSYWKDVLLDYLCNRSGNTLSIKEVSQEMAIYSYDIVSTLQALGMMKYWKGKHIVLKKQDVLDEYAERVKRRGNFPKIDDTCLRWCPFVPTQTNDS